MHSRHVGKSSVLERHEWERLTLACRSAPHPAQPDMLRVSANRLVILGRRSHWRRATRTAPPMRALHVCRTHLAGPRTAQTRAPRAASVYRNRFSSRFRNPKPNPQSLPRAPGWPMDSTNARPRAASGWRATHRLRTAASGAPRRKRRVARLPSGKRSCTRKACGAPARILGFQKF